MLVPPIINIYVKGAMRGCIQVAVLSNNLIIDQSDQTIVPVQINDSQVGVFCLVRKSCLATRVTSYQSHHHRGGNSELSSDHGVVYSVYYAYTDHSGVSIQIIL